MVSNMVRHQQIHLNNPHINYIRLENCAFCKRERMMNYCPRATPRNPRINNYFFNSHLIYYDNPAFGLDFEDVEVLTSLKSLNSSTKLKVCNNPSFCTICQDKIEIGTICRVINCGHFFHYECCDKWLETNSNCPTCRFSI